MVPLENETVEEVVHRALEAQDADESWLEDRELIQRKIGRGLAQLDAGEGIPAEVAKARTPEKKGGVA